MGTRMAKIGGILQEVSGEELARQTGLEAPPTSPLGMQGIGASQDVAKMAGTGEQVRAVLRETLKERTDTRDVMGEAERGATRGRFNVAQIQQQLQTLSGVGSLDNRVAEEVRKRITGVGAAGEPKFENTIDDKAIANALTAAGFIGDPAAKIAEVRAALVSLRDNGTKPALVGVLAALGIKATIDDTASDLATKLQNLGVINQAGAADIKKRFDETAEATKDLKVKDLGANIDFDKTLAAQVLGITADKLEGMTLAEVKAQLAAYRSETFTDLDELREALTNPFSSQSQKDFARKRLAELGALGVTSVEQKTDNLQTQMEEGDTVKVGNKQVKVEEIMTDQTLRLTVATALDSPEELEKLRKTDKDLADWIEKNQKALQNVRGQLTAGLTDFATNQKAKKDYLAKAPADLLDKLTPGWREASDADFATWKASLATSSPTLVHVLDKLQDPKTSKGYDFALDAVSTLSADQVKTFSTAVLDSIASNANSGEEAKTLLRSYQGTQDQNWIASIVEPSVPAFDVDFGAEDYKSVVEPALAQFAPGFTSIKDLVDKINELRVSNNVADRAKAIDLAGQLANIKGELARNLTPDKIAQTKEKNKTTREKAELNQSFGLVDSTIGKIVKSLGERGDDHLARRGAEVFADIKSQAKGIALDLQLGRLSFVDAQNKIKELQTNMAGQLAAFFFDDNHRIKNPPASMDAVQLLLDSGVSANLSPSDRTKLKNLLRETETFYKEQASRGSINNPNWQRDAAWAERAGALNDKL